MDGQGKNGHAHDSRPRVSGDSCTERRLADAGMGMTTNLSRFQQAMFGNVCFSKEPAADSRVSGVVLIVDDLAQLETAWLLLAVAVQLGNQRMRKEQ